MVCSIGTGKMTALTRLLNAGSASKTLTEEVGCLKLAAQHLTRKLREADEENLLNEEDMHIFGRRPMTDPLNLVCCNACKKPIKASQYAAHAEFCKSLNAGADNNGLQPEVCAIDKKPPRKKMKKLLIKQTKKVSSFREPKKFQAINSHCIAASRSDVDGKIQMVSSADPKQNVHQNSTHKMNGSRAPCNMETEEDIANHLPLKRTAAGNSQNPDAKGSCRTAGVLPHIPAPLATKIYYSQRTHYLRTAICHMFFQEANNQVVGFPI